MSNKPIPTFDEFCDMKTIHSIWGPSFSINEMRGSQATLDGEQISWSDRGREMYQHWIDNNLFAGEMAQRDLHRVRRNRYLED